MREGTRGGTTTSLPEAQGLYEEHRPVSAEQIRHLILTIAAEKGEVHADDLAELELGEANIIGAQFNALTKAGRIEKLNKHGEVEHRKATNPASHGRASYVWRLTRLGSVPAAQAPEGPPCPERTLQPGESPKQHPSQPGAPPQGAGQILEVDLERLERACAIAKLHKGATLEHAVLAACRSERRQEAAA